MPAPLASLEWIVGPGRHYLGMPTTIRTSLTEITAGLPPVDVALCDPLDLATHTFRALDEFLQAASRTDLPPEVQMLLSERASGSMLSYSSTEVPSPGLVASTALLRNFSWSECALAKVAAHLPSSWEHQVGFVGTALLLAHPQVSEQAVLAAIYALTIDNTFHLQVRPAPTRSALALLGNFSLVTSVAAVLGERLRAQSPEDTGLRRSLPMNTFMALARRTAASLGSPEAMEIWCALQEDCEEHSGDLVTLSALLAGTQAPV